MDSDQPLQLNSMPYLKSIFPTMQDVLVIGVRVFYRPFTVAELVLFKNCESKIILCISTSEAKKSPQCIATCNDKDLSRA